MFYSRAAGFDSTLLLSDVRELGLRFASCTLPAGLSSGGAHGFITVGSWFVGSFTVRSFTASKSAFCFAYAFVFAAFSLAQYFLVFSARAFSSTLPHCSCLAVFFSAAGLTASGSFMSFG